MEESTTITNPLITSVNELFNNIFASVDNSIYDLLDNLVFINEDIVNKGSFSKLFGSNATSGILMICNALILGIIIFYSCNYLFSHLTYSKIQTPAQFIFKCIIFVGIMNESLWICSQIINIISLVSNSLQYVGNQILGEEITFINFISKINDIFYTLDGEINITSFDGIIKSIMTIGFVNLIFSYSLRYVMVQVFILMSPFSFLSLINDRTEWIFKSWIKTFLSLLFEQILIVFILLLAFSFGFSSNSVMSKILLIGIIYALMKANTFMYMIFGGITTSISGNMGTMLQRNN